MLDIHKNYIRRAMESYKGDNLERANHAFKNKSDSELDRPYGQSGKTCREIWQEYKDDRQLHNAALAALESL